MVMALEVVALAFCPASVAEVALVSVPLVVALGAVVLVSVPLVVALGAELEVEGELDMVDEVSPAVPDGMLLLGEALASGWAVDELEVLDWA
jgi:hypothetical protein